MTRSICITNKSKQDRNMEGGEYFVFGCSSYLATKTRCKPQFIIRLVCGSVPNLQNKLILPSQRQVTQHKLFSGYWNNDIINNILIIYFYYSVWWSLKLKIWNDTVSFNFLCSIKIKKRETKKDVICKGWTICISESAAFMSSYYRKHLDLWRATEISTFEIQAFHLAG